MPSAARETKRTVGAHEFQFVDVIRPATDTAGGIVEYTHQLPEGVRPNRYADGPFCRFRLSGAPSGAGVYLIFAGEQLKYVGECENLLERFGPRGYGEIAARNCHSDGQATNCKINSAILVAVKSGQQVSVYFHPASDRMAVEAELVEALRPPWNGRKTLSQRKVRPAPVGGQASPTTVSFVVALAGC